MPLREYKATAPEKGCGFCVQGFEQLEAVDADPAVVCPQCGGPVQRQWSVSRTVQSRSGADDRARQAGFHKLKKVSKGEYEKIY